MRRCAQRHSQASYSRLSVHPRLGGHRIRLPAASIDRAPAATMRAPLPSTGSSSSRASGRQVSTTAVFSDRRETGAQSVSRRIRSRKSLAQSASARRAACATSSDDKYHAGDHESRQVHKFRSRARPVAPNLDIAALRELDVVALCRPDVAQNPLTIAPTSSASGIWLPPHRAPSHRPPMEGHSPIQAPQFVPPFSLAYCLDITGDRLGGR